MKTLRRHNIPGATYFVAVVTENREPLLVEHVTLFWESWKGRALDAWVILPDHFHSLITLETETISNVMHAFKISFSRRIRDNVRPGKVWQNRFWEHVIRDEEDLNRHLDYIHYNPVRHGLAANPFDYPHSSLQRYFENGMYETNWRYDENEEEGLFGE